MWSFEPVYVVTISILRIFIVGVCLLLLHILLLLADLILGFRLYTYIVCMFVASLSFKVFRFHVGKTYLQFKIATE